MEGDWSSPGDGLDSAHADSASQLHAHTEDDWGGNDKEADQAFADVESKMGEGDHFADDTDAMQEEMSKRWEESDFHEPDDWSYEDPNEEEVVDPELLDVSEESLFGADRDKENSASIDELQTEGDVPGGFDTQAGLDEPDAAERNVFSGFSTHTEPEEGYEDFTEDYFPDEEEDPFEDPEFDIDQKFETPPLDPDPVEDLPEDDYDDPFPEDEELIGEGEKLDISEEDLIDLMYEDRHLSPYRRVFNMLFDDYPNEEELLDLYKQVAGDLFSLSKKDGDSESDIRWKIYNEIYLHHYKESFLRRRTRYPTDREIFRFQKEFHTLLDRQKKLEPEEVRQEAATGEEVKKVDEEKESLEVCSPLDIPEEKDETEVGETNTVGSDAEADSTKAAEKDPTEVEDDEEEDEELQTFEAEPSEEVEGEDDIAGEKEDDELVNEQLDPTEAEADDTEATAGEDDEAAADDPTEGQQPQDPESGDENVVVDTDPTKVEDTDPAEEQLAQDAEPSQHQDGTRAEVKPDEPEEKAPDSPSEPGADREAEEKMNITEQREEEEVPVSTTATTPDDSERESGGHDDEPGRAETPPGRSEAEAAAESPSAEAEGGESSSAPETVAPVPTSSETAHLKLDPEVVVTTIIEDGVTTLIQDGRTTEVVDGTTIVDEEPEVFMSTPPADLVQPSASVIENTASGQSASGTEAATGSQKPTAEMPDPVVRSMPSEGEQRDEPGAAGMEHAHGEQGAHVADSLSSDGGSSASTDDASVVAGEEEPSQSKTEDEPEGDTAQEDDQEETEPAAEGPGEVDSAMLDTNQTEDSAAEEGDVLQQLDAYSPSGEYVSRTLQSHQPSESAVLQQPDSANTGENGASVQSSEQQPGDASQNDETVPSPPEHSAQPEAVTPPGDVDDGDEQVPLVDSAEEGVTEPTPVLVDVPEDKGDGPPPDQEENVQQDPSEGFCEGPTCEEEQIGNPTGNPHGNPYENPHVVPSEDEGWLMWYGRKVDAAIAAVDPLLIAIVDYVSSWVRFHTVPNTPHTGASVHLALPNISKIADHNELDKHVKTGSRCQTTFQCAVCGPQPPERNA